MTTPPKLSPREREVFMALVHGDRPKEIGHALGISEKTVAVHKFNVTKKTKLHSPLEFYKAAVGWGWIEEERKAARQETRKRYRHSDKGVEHMLHQSVTCLRCEDVTATMEEAMVTGRRLKGSK